MSAPVRRLALSLLLPALLIGGCGRPTSRERDGDRMYAVGRYREALTAYRGAGDANDPGARLLAKRGAAALRSGAAADAVEAYARLADADDERADEAAEGLALAARLAADRGELPTLRAAVEALQRIEPARPLGRLALQVARADGDRAGVALLPVAIAAAPGATAVDSLLVSYGLALEAAGRCDRAVEAYGAAARRADDAPLRSQARAGVAGCSARLAQAALDGNDTTAAMRWLRRAAADSTSDVARRALLDLGRLAAAEGDAVRAASAFRAVITRHDGRDALTREAERRLDDLFVPQDAGDSARTSVP